MLFPDGQVIGSTRVTTSEAHSDEFQDIKALLKKCVSHDYISLRGKHYYRAYISSKNY